MTLILVRIQDENYCIVRRLTGEEEDVVSAFYGTLHVVEGIVEDIVESLEVFNSCSAR